MKYIFNSKVDWWIPVVVIGSVAVCFIGPMIDGDFIPGIILAVVVFAVEILTFAGVKYQIRDGQLGIRNFFHWTWYPIDRISEVKKSRGILSAPALSSDRISIRFSDRSILKSFLPLEISPKNRDEFIGILKRINSRITVR